MTFTFVKTPRHGRLEEISAWLKEERDASGEGFFCNISVISKAFTKKEACCVVERNKAIAFLIFSIRRKKARIDIAEVHPAFRGKGAGRFLVEKTIEMFQSRGAYISDLECQPVESESFWRKMGFTDVPAGVDPNYYSEWNRPITLFRAVSECQEVGSGSSCEDVLELWDVPPWDSRDKPPKWTWRMVVKSSPDLVKPIIHPANRDWRLRWRKGDKVFKDEKVKYFCPESADWCSYIAFTKLPPDN